MFNPKKYFLLSSLIALAFTFSLVTPLTACAESPLLLIGGAESSLPELAEEAPQLAPLPDVTPALVGSTSVDAPELRPAMVMPTAVPPYSDNGQVIEVNASDFVLDLDSSQNNRLILAPAGTVIRFGLSDLKVTSAELVNPLPDDFDEIHDSHVVSMKVKEGRLLPGGKIRRLPIFVKVAVESKNRMGNEIQINELVIPKAADDGSFARAKSQAQVPRGEMDSVYIPSL